MNTGRGFRDPGREQAPATRFPALRRLRGSQTSARDAHCANPPILAALSTARAAFTSGLRPRRSLLNIPSVRERWIDLQAPDEFCEQGVRCRSCRQLPNLEGVSL